MKVKKMKDKMKEVNQDNQEKKDNDIHEIIHNTESNNEDCSDNQENTEIDEDLEFLKNQIRHRKMIQDKKKEEEQEDYSYIKRFKINSYIETVAGIIALVLGIVTKNYLTDCLGIALICFGYLFRNIAKHGEYKRNKEKK